MKKLSLNLEDLKVESFQTTPEVEGADNGTVFGYISFGPGNTCDPGCNDLTNTCTCGNTCSGNTCSSTCNGTCASDTCGSTCSVTCGSTCFNTCSGCPGNGPTCQPLCNTSFGCGFCR